LLKGLVAKARRVPCVFFIFATFYDIAVPRLQAHYTVLNSGPERGHRQVTSWTPVSCLLQIGVPYTGRLKTCRALFLTASL